MPGETGFFCAPLGRVEQTSPYFIVGCARSGTTLLQHILNAHPDLAVFGETEAFFNRRKYGLLSRPHHLQRLLRDWRNLLSTASPYADIVDQAGVIEKLQHCASYAQAIDVLMREFMAREGKRIWCEKTPAHVHRLPAIASAFPQAKIIHIIRDPRSIIASNIRAFYDGSFSDWNVYKLAKIWVQSIAQPGRSGIAEEKIFTLRYEDLLASQESTLTCLLAFIAVDASAATVAKMLQFHRQAERYAQKKEGSEIVPHHLLLLQKITTSRSEAWRKDLSAAHVRIIESVASGQMLRHGYHLENDRAHLSFGYALFLRWRWRVWRTGILARRYAMESFWALRNVVLDAKNG